MLLSRWQFKDLQGEYRDAWSAKLEHVSTKQRNPFPIVFAAQVQETIRLEVAHVAKGEQMEQPAATAMNSHCEGKMGDRPQKFATAAHPMDSAG